MDNDLPLTQEAANLVYFICRKMRYVRKNYIHNQLKIKMRYGSYSITITVKLRLKHALEIDFVCVPLIEEDPIFTQAPVPVQDIIFVEDPIYPPEEEEDPS